MKHSWHNQNEDHRELNDVSSVEFTGGLLTVKCNDGEWEFPYEGEPVTPAGEQLATLEQSPAGWEQWYAAEVATLFGVRLV